MTTAPKLAVTSRGDTLELRPDGSWIAANVIALETLADAVAPQAERAKSLKMDMSGLSELDTLGAWLLEKLSRRVASANHPAADPIQLINQRREPQRTRLANDAEQRDAK